MKILAIETSCDETSVCLMVDRKIIDLKVWSQSKYFEEYGGVVPQIASQLHGMKLPFLLNQIKNNFDLNQLDLIAYTNKPGLIGCLTIGETVAKTIAQFYQKPLIKINHLHAHLYANNLENEIQFPALGIILSGGHTQMVYMEKPLSFKIIGQTLDDAVGEVIDKVGRELNIPYPAGPQIENLSKNGKNNYKFNIYQKKNLNFSFAGLKTYSKNLIQAENKKQKLNINDFCYSLQKTIFENIKKKVEIAMQKYKIKNIIMGGGVCANQHLKKIIQELKIKVLIPKIEYCTDNAAMVAILAHYKTMNNKEKKWN